MAIESYLAVIQTLIEQRLLARQSGDYATSDRLRCVLLDYGVEVNDSKI